MAVGSISWYICFGFGGGGKHDANIRKYVLLIKRF